MFIELTDHLRCPTDHDEAFLVLLPDAMEGRSVVAGKLGCPVCDRQFRIEAGVLDVGGEPPSVQTGSSALDPTAIATLAGIHGPGGYFVLVGAPATLWRDVLALNPRIALVGVNPDGSVVDAPGLSVLRGGMIPLKANSVRGVVLGPGYAEDAGWVREAARVTLPGLRIVGEGGDPSADVVDLMATAGGVWVGSKRR